MPSGAVPPVPLVTSGPVRPGDVVMGCGYRPVASGRTTAEGDVMRALQLTQWKHEPEIRDVAQPDVGAR